MNRIKFLVVPMLLAGTTHLAYGLDPTPTASKSTAVNTSTGAASFTCGNSLPKLTITFGSNVPHDQVINNQGVADCFAWSEFISLNWPESGSSFGDPGDTAPVQWETYMDASLLFNKNGTPPPPWGTLPSVPANCGEQAHLSATALSATRLFASSSKFDPTFSFEQAAPKDAPSWLGAQSGGNVWYEMRVNQDQYNYVNQNKLYNANEQTSFVNNGQGSPIVLPKGSSTSATVGAIELKGAWIEAVNYSSDNPKWKRYKLTKGVVIDPSTQQCRATTMALVGMHIIHKTTTQPTWIWATFEHVDNVPTPNVQAPTTGYNFYNTHCSNQTVSVPAACLPAGANSDSQQVSVGCTPNVSPPYNLGLNCPNPVPIQVTRINALGQDAQSTNSLVQGQIKQNYSNSVWQYYQLVDVLWSTNPTQDPTKPIKVPHPLTSMTSENGGLVANTTMETYAQTDTCTDCHKSGAIAGGTWSADFSFLFATAGPEKSNALLTRKLKMAK